MDDEAGPSEGRHDSLRSPDTRPWWLVGIALVSAAVVFPGLGAMDIWHDEAASLHFARLPWSELPGALGERDNHGPAYFALLHLWTDLFGGSPTVVRLPSVIATVLTSCVVALLGERLHGRRAGIGAGLLFATSPLLLWHAQEVRFYALAVLAAALQLLLAHRALRRPTFGRLAALATCVAVGFLTFYLSALVTAGIAAAVIVSRGPERTARVRVVLALALGGVLTSPWWPFLLMQSGHALRYLSWIPDEPAIAFVVRALTELVGGVDATHWAFAVAGSVVVVAALRALIVGLRLRRPREVLPLLCVVVPVVAVLVLSLRQSFLLVRYLLVAAPAVYVLVGSLLDAEDERTERSRVARVGGTAAFVFVLVAQLVGVAQYHTTPKRDLDWTGAVTLIQAQARPGDAVAITPHWDRYSLDHHLPNHTPVLSLRAERDVATQIPDGTRRLWLLQSFDEGVPVREQLAAEWSVQHRTSHGELTLLLVVRP